MTAKREELASQLVKLKYIYIKKTISYSWRSLEGDLSLEFLNRKNALVTPDVKICRKLCKKCSKYDYERIIFVKKIVNFI